MVDEAQERSMEIQLHIEWDKISGIAGLQLFCLFLSSFWPYILSSSLLYSVLVSIGAPGIIPKYQFWNFVEVAYNNMIENGPTIVTFFFSFFQVRHIKNWSKKAWNMRLYRNVCISPFIGKERREFDIYVFFKSQNLSFMVPFAPLLHCLYLNCACGFVLQEVPHHLLDILHPFEGMWITHIFDRSLLWNVLFHVQAYSCHRFSNWINWLALL